MKSRYKSLNADDVKGLFKKYGLLFLTAVSITAGQWREKREIPKEMREPSGTAENEEILESEWAEQMERGYNLPIDDIEREEAERDCKTVMESISGIYKLAEKGSASNTVIADETITRMAEAVKNTGCPVVSANIYTNMENYSKMDEFLMASRCGKPGEIVTYEILTDGGVKRIKYIFDGTDMYALGTAAEWNKEYKPAVTYDSYTRIKEWNYTDKGWFVYEYCVPEPPEVSEMIPGGRVLRVKPFDEEYSSLAKRYLWPPGYQGSNLLCSNWDVNNMGELDYNGLFEYLYTIKYQRPFPKDDYESGIPKNEFENMITEYLPITAEQLQKYAVYDEEGKSYEFSTLGCGNFAPSLLGYSIPEIVDKKENPDGTITWVIEAVSAYGKTDALISHELTVGFRGDGTIRYMSNHILDDDLKYVPEYIYRIQNKERREQ